MTLSNYFYGDDEFVTDETPESWEAELEGAGFHTVDVDEIDEDFEESSFTDGSAIHAHDQVAKAILRAVPNSGLTRCGVCEQSHSDRDLVCGNCGSPTARASRAAQESMVFGIVSRVASNHGFDVTQTGETDLGVPEITVTGHGDVAAVYSELAELASRLDADPAFVGHGSQLETLIRVSKVGRQFRSQLDKAKATVKA